MKALTILMVQARNTSKIIYNIGLGSHTEGKMIKWQNQTIFTVVLTLFLNRSLLPRVKCVKRNIRHLFKSVFDHLSVLEKNYTIFLGVQRFILKHIKHVQLCVVKQLTIRINQVPVARDIEHKEHQKCSATFIYQKITQLQVIQKPLRQLKIGTDL